ncbi:hypothetical protein [Paenibacillus sp. SI8]|uniref:hypothetical protein n=1 Tax=unclassified Paenibacillus TaxID=185978 RepID=UPI0034657A59
MRNGLDSYEAYRAGYHAGYFRGRIAQLNGEGYDERTPMEHEGGAEKTYGDPWEDEKR